MVAGKVRLAMGLQKSPANPKHETPPKPPLPSPNSGNKNSTSQKSTVLSRSFGGYFPKSSAQVQPRPPDVTELIRWVEELRERESRLKTELIEHKLLKESVAVVPVLENEILAKSAELERALREIENLRNENEMLRTETEKMKAEIEEERKESEQKFRDMKEEMAELKKTLESTSRYGSSEAKVTGESESDESLSSSQRFQGLVEVGVKSNLIKNLKRSYSKCTDAVVFRGLNDEKTEIMEFKKEEFETQRPRHLRYNSDELVESTLVNIRSRVARVPKPPPRSSSSTSSASSNSSSDSKEKHISPPAPPPPPPPAPVSSVKQITTPQPPPPPAPVSAVKQITAPPPPPPLPMKAIAPLPPPLPQKGTKAVSAKVRRIPEVVEFYHSLMRRDSKREPGGCNVPESLPATANARDMIGEIENRSAYLLAVSFSFQFYFIYDNATMAVWCLFSFCYIRQHLDSM